MDKYSVWSTMSPTPKPFLARVNDFRRETNFLLYLSKNWPFHERQKLITSGYTGCLHVTAKKTRKRCHEIILLSELLSLWAQVRNVSMITKRKSIEKQVWFCVAAVKSRLVLHHCVVIFFWSSGIMECICTLFTFENGVLLMR